MKRKDRYGMDRPLTDIESRKKQKTGLGTTRALRIGTWCQAMPPYTAYGNNSLSFITVEVKQHRSCTVVWDESEDVFAIGSKGECSVTRPGRLESAEIFIKFQMMVRLDRISLRQAMWMAYRTRQSLCGPTTMPRGFTRASSVGRRSRYVDSGS